MNRTLKLLAGCLLTFAIHNQAECSSGKNFDRAIFVIFENVNYKEALKQPFFSHLAQEGVHFTNFMAEAHPSQGNYIALTSGALHGVSNDNSIDLDVSNIADLLEAKGLTWKVYAEDYPGNCFTGTSVLDYARKHNPFISYLNIQKNPTRCAHIVNADEFDKDSANGNLPNYVFYVPNNKNNGHDTSATFADQWYGERFSKFVADKNFMASTILVSTFDESGFSVKNQVYTTIVGPSVKAQQISSALNHYSLLRLLEDNWDLGNLGQHDVDAPLIPNIWK